MRNHEKMHITVVIREVDVLDTATVRTISLKKQAGLAFWMRRVLQECDRASIAFAPDPVHDLRVALRRCCSMADGIAAIDPDRAWKDMKKADAEYLWAKEKRRKGRNKVQVFTPPRHEPGCHTTLKSCTSTARRHR